MNIQELTDNEIAQLIDDCRKELQSRIDKAENIIAKDDLQHYKSLYARLTLFYDFCQVTYRLKETELSEKFGSRRTKIIRNALINYLLDNGFSHADIEEEFNLARTSVNSKRTYHESNYLSNQLYTEIYKEVKRFFEN